MTTVITILAYKSSGFHSMRNCVMDRWDSDFEMFTTIDEDAAVAWLGDMLVKNHDLKLGSYEFTVLINGIESQDWIDGETDEEQNARLVLHTKIVEEAKAVMAKAVEEEKAKAEAARVAARAAAEAKVKADELQLLASLRAKHGV